MIPADEQFTGYAFGQSHARQWATNMYGPDHADAFVEWLLNQSLNEQHYIYLNGYPICEKRFEAEVMQERWRA